jgi:hypothetical protein
VSVGANPAVLPDEFFSGLSCYPNFIHHIHSVGIVACIKEGVFMKRLALGLMAVLFSTAVAQAEDRFAVAYGNTVTQTMPDGGKIVIYVNADKTWERHMGDKIVKGTYAWQDDSHVCFTTTDPAPADPSKASNCSEIKGDHKVGDTWTEPMGGGKNITMAITAGR